MSEHIKQIASRIKELREIYALSQETLSHELNISLETYQRYESGNTDIPVSFLYEIANKFKVELSAILTGGDPKLHVYSVTRKNNGVNVERRKDYNYQSLANNFIHKKAEPFLVSVDPQANEAEVHLNSHPGQEFNYILEGTMKVIINHQEIILEEGDSIYFDSSYGHAMKALNNKRVQFLAIIL